MLSMKFSKNKYLKCKRKEKTGLRCSPHRKDLITLCKKQRRCAKKAKDTIYREQYQSEMRQAGWRSLHRWHRRLRQRQNQEERENCGKLNWKEEIWNCKEKKSWPFEKVRGEGSSWEWKGMLESRLAQERGCRGWMRLGTSPLDVHSGKCQSHYLLRVTETSSN